jgi:membrane dipeptidase
MKEPSAVTIHDVVDHIWHLADVAGWEHVGIGSDFSGTPHTPAGLEVRIQDTRICRVLLMYHIC